MLRAIVDKDVNVWQRKIILRTSFVEISIVHTYPNLSILLRYRYDVCQLMVGYNLMF